MASAEGTPIGPGFFIFFQHEDTGQGGSQFRDTGLRLEHPPEPEYKDINADVDRLVKIRAEDKEIMEFIQFIIMARIL